ncbi:Alpha/Beta hydrolase protein [Pisolithus croceorrhizus]|nr:Alpha/Beta hydrolase protein [Pisolithus croceorrhizus]
MELGPCRVLSDGGSMFNPFSWNSNASVFFIDRPIGVSGFSYTDYATFRLRSTTGEATKDIATFVAIFFQNSKNRSFHMAGES